MTESQSPDEKHQPQPFVENDPTKTPSVVTVSQGSESPTDSDHQKTVLGDDAQDAMEVENLIESYQILADWIRFADAKAAAVLTVNGALASLLIPPLRQYLIEEQMHPMAGWGIIVTVAFLAWLITMIGSCVHSFRCILPYARRGTHPAVGHADHFHPAAIAERYALDAPDKFADDFERIGMTGLKKEVAVCMLVDSHISSHKYKQVTRAIRMLALSAILGLLYLLSIQF